MDFGSFSLLCSVFFILPSPNSEVVYAGPTGNPQSTELTEESFFLLPGFYTFELHDSREDGLTGGILGWHEIRVQRENGDYRLVRDRQNGNFRKIQITNFQVEGTQPPMDSESAAPSPTTTYTTTDDLYVEDVKTAGAGSHGAQDESDGGSSGWNAFLAFLLYQTIFASLACLFVWVEPVAAGSGM